MGRSLENEELAEAAAELKNRWQRRGYRDAKEGKLREAPLVTQSMEDRDDYKRGYERRVQQERTTVAQEYESRTGKKLGDGRRL